MRLFPESGQYRFPRLIVYVIVIAAVCYAALRYLIPALLPFLIAFVLAALLRRPTLALCRQTRMPPRLVAALTAILFALILFGALTLIGRILFSELGGFVRAVMSGENALIENLGSLLSRLWRLADRIPLLGSESRELRRLITDTVLDTAKGILSDIGTGLPVLAARLAAAIPQVLIFCTVTLLACVYICMDYDTIVNLLRKHIRGRLRERISRLRAITVKTASGIFRSYAVLFLLTFSELLVGFLILKESYAFLLALLTAAVDALPIFGIGTVILPMALYRIFVGDIHGAIGLCILYAVVTIIRQIAEPRLLGANIGMHPLLTLTAMYAGLKLFGLPGMILCPPLAVIIGRILKSIPANQYTEQS